MKTRNQRDGVFVLSEVMQASPRTLRGLLQNDAGEKEGRKKSFRASEVLLLSSHSLRRVREGGKGQGKKLSKMFEWTQNSSWEDILVVQR